MTTLNQEQYDEIRSMLHNHADLFTEREREIFANIVREGANCIPIPDGWAIQGWGALIRVWRERKARGEDVPRPKVPFVIAGD